MDAAMVLGDERYQRFVLVLDQPRMIEARIRAELERAKDVFRPGVVDRLFVVMRYGEQVFELGHPLPPVELEAAKCLLNRHGKTPQPVRNRRHGAGFDILRLLVLRWIRKEGPISSKDLCEISGFSYPTVAATLMELKTHIKRRSDRSVELVSLPRNAWLEWISKSEKIRTSLGYVDRSGRPRTPEAMVQKLKKLNREDIAIGGVLGARHYLPGLDLVGTPRLDLSVHSRPSLAAGDFIRQLDPALVPAEPGEFPHLVVHTLNQPHAFFTKDLDGTLWADEVDCLLDLLEARLEPQAKEFLDSLTSS